MIFLQLTFSNANYMQMSDHSWKKIPDLLVSTLCPFSGTLMMPLPLPLPSLPPSLPGSHHLLPTAARSGLCRPEAPTQARVAPQGGWDGPGAIPWGAAVCSHLPAELSQHLERLCQGVLGMRHGQGSWPSPPT